MKKSKIILKSIMWPVLLGIGQLIISFFFFLSFQIEKFNFLKFANPHMDSKGLNQLLETYLNSKQGQAGFIQYMEHYLWLIILINIFILIPLFWYIYKKNLVKHNKIGGKSVITITSMSVSLGLFLNIVLSFVDQSGRYDIKPIQIMLLISTAIVGPILEEIVFRGITYETLKKGFTKRISMIIVTVLFAISHGSFFQILYAFAMGSLFIFFLEKYKSIYASITSHILSNMAVGIGIPFLMMCPISVKIVCMILFLSIFFVNIFKQVKKT